MTFSEADTLIKQHSDLVGKDYYDGKKKQAEKILSMVVTPQDHPFFPEFLDFYRKTGSYDEASKLSYQKHADEILYRAKCVMDELYDLEDNLPMHVMVNLQHVLQIFERA
jgi:hypothetical protein